MKRNSAPHTALLFMKMMESPIVPFDLNGLAPQRFRNGKAREILNSLVSRGFARNEGDKYAITPQGLEQVRTLALGKRPRC
jgi:hypothetical protein